MTAQRCTRAIAEACDDRDLQPTLTYMRRTPRLICGACRAFMEARGIEFRVVDETLAVRADDTSWQPVWLRGLRARDETGLVSL